MALKVLSNLLTNSRKKTARRCLREHQLQYDLGYRSVHQADELRFGSLVHLGLEAWWLAVQRGTTPEERLSAAFAAMQGEADPFERAKAEVLLAGYEARWGADAEQYEVIGVELEFRAPIRNPSTGAASRTWRAAGKLDALVRHLPTDRVLIVEHKTSSEDITPGSDYWLRLRIDGQVSDYFAGAEALGHTADGCLYDVLGKPGIRPGTVPLTDEDGLKIVVDASGNRVRTKDGKRWRQTADAAEGYLLQTRPETPDEYRERIVELVSQQPDRFYQRGEVARLDADLEEARFDTWQIGKLIREAQLAGRAPRNPDACVRYGRKCAFFDVCTGAASLDDPTRFVRLDNVHPELTVEDAANDTHNHEEEETAA